MEIFVLGTAAEDRLSDSKDKADLSQNKKDKRTGSSILIAYKNKNILFDVSSDVNEQLSKIDKIPTEVFITHIHPNHMLGILKTLKAINFYATEKDIAVIKKAFGKFLTGTVNFKPIRNKETIELDGLKITPYSVTHSIPTFGFRIEEEGKSLAYVPIFKDLPDRMLILNTNIAILDGTTLEPHSDHMEIAESLKRAKAWRVHSLNYTHIGHVLLHETLKEYVKTKWNRANILFDGQKLTLAGNTDEKD